MFSRKTCEEGRTLNILREYVEKSKVEEYCTRCLNCERWGKNVILMIVDASFTSLGLNYFNAVVPKVLEFREVFVRTGKITSLEDLANYNIEELRKVWKNARSWRVAKDISKYLAELKKEKNLNDREAFIYWGRSSSLENWKNDPIGRIKGIGINTYQYLRMMAGIDTVMPDKIVRKVLEGILGKLPEDDIEFIKCIERIAKKANLRAIDICWMTWFVNSDVVNKYSEVLPEI